MLTNRLGSNLSMGIHNYDGLEYLINEEERLEMKGF